jgi:hypothetical protein
MSHAIKKIAIAIALVGLTACGGGDEDNSESGSNNNNTGGNTGNGTYVAGSFKSSTNGGILAPFQGLGYGYNSNACADHDYYFESANAIIIGNQNLPEEDFKYAATLVENQIPIALSSFNITITDFTDNRPYFVGEVAREIISFLADGWHYQVGDDYFSEDITNLSLNVPFVAPEDWNTLHDNNKYQFVQSYWNSLSHENQIAVSKQYKEVFKKEYPHITDNPLTLRGENIYVPEKIMVCLSTEMNESRYGEGTIFGMNIPPKSYADRTDAADVVLHEIIHTIQHNMYSPIEGMGGVIDHWFIEGQATYLAGQSIASDPTGYYPVEVITYFNEGNEFSGDSSLPYKHYALAYSYLDKNKKTPNQMKNMFYDIRTFTGVESNMINNFSSDNFRNAFDNNMIKKDGNPLTLSSFRSDYQNIMNN